MPINSYGYEPLITLEANEIELKELLKVIAEPAKKGIIISEKVVGTTAVFFNDLPWQEALEGVIQANGLVKYESEGLIIIATATEHLPLQQKIFKPTYLAAEELSKVLAEAKVLSARGKVVVDNNANSLIVSDLSNSLVEIDKVFKELDVPVKQVFIEARIVSADKIFLRELGLEYGSVSKSSTNNKFRLSDQNKFVAGQLNLAIAKLPDNKTLDLKLTALENEGRGQVFSKPKLLTRNRQPASIETGAEIPYQEKTKDGNTSVAFKKAVLSLTVTPEIMANESIKLVLQLNQDKIGQQYVNGVPTIDTRKIATQVIAQNGETVVLGGIYEWSKVKTTKGIPVLRKIPILKMFFETNETRLERKELLIFITPKIVK